MILAPVISLISSDMGDGPGSIHQRGHYSIIGEEEEIVICRLRYFNIRWGEAMCETRPLMTPEMNPRQTF